MTYAGSLKKRKGDQSSRLLRVSWNSFSSTKPCWKARGDNWKKQRKGMNKVSLNLFPLPSR